MGSKTVKTTEKTSGTTTPQVPEYAMPAITNYFGGISRFGDAINSGSAASWMPPTNANQQAAYSMGQGLTGANENLADAGNFTRQAIGMANQPDARMPSQMGFYTAGNPALAGLGDLGDAGDYEVNPASIDSLVNANAARGSQYMNDYLDPMTAEIDAILAEYEQDAAEQRALMEGEALVNKGLGGSGYALSRGQFDADTLRGKNALRGNMVMDARKTAIGAGLQDAGMFTQTGITNANNANQRARDQAGLTQQARIHNSGLGSQFDLTRFLAENDLSRYNTDATNTFRLADAQGLNENERLRYGTEANMNQFIANQRLQQNAQRLAGAGLLGELGNTQTQDQLSRAQGLLSLGQAQYGTDLANSPYGQLLALSGLLNPSGTLNTVTGQNVTGESNGTKKESGGLFRDILMAAMANASKIGSMGGG